MFKIKGELLLKNLTTNIKFKTALILIILLISQVSFAGKLFIKISSSGIELPDSASEWACVKHKTTGQIWEVKTTENNEDRYTFDTASNLVVELNNKNLCGYTDWRMPSVKELLSITDKSIDFPGPVINTNYFPNIGTGIDYWTANAHSAFSNDAWFVRFNFGYSQSMFKTTGFHVRLVRGEKYFDLFDYTKLDSNGNNLPNSASNWSCVRDNKSGLIWEVKTSNKLEQYKLDELPSYVDKINQSALCGFNDWSVPSVNQLEMLVDFSAYSPAIKGNYFPYTFPTVYWSSTTYPNGKGWGLDFKKGLASIISNYNSMYTVVRLVHKANTTNSPTEPAITITSPNSSASYKKGDKVTVNWSTQNTSGNAEIIISMKRDAASGLTAPDNKNWYRFTVFSGSFLNDGKETITIPDSVNLANDWRFYVSIVDSDHIYDVSDAQFSVTQNVETEISLIERNSLIVFYNATGGNNWKNNSGWLGEAGSECDWYGISCTNNHVTSIHLNNNQLRGIIPKNLNLSKLRFLYLYNNQLTGQIPDELSQLTELEHLSLSYNQLTEQIPSNLAQLTQLKLLNLRANQLSGSIPKEFGKLILLESLVVSGNKLTGDIPNELGQLTQLQELFISANQLTGQIPNELKRLYKLKALYLSNNCLNPPSPSFVSFFNFIGRSDITRYSENTADSINACQKSTTILTSEKLGAPGIHKEKRADGKVGETIRVDILTNGYVVNGQFDVSHDLFVQCIAQDSNRTDEIPYQSGIYYSPGNKIEATFSFNEPGIKLIECVTIDEDGVRSKQRDIHEILVYPTANIPTVNPDIAADGSEFLSVAMPVLMYKGQRYKAFLVQHRVEGKQGIFFALKSEPVKLDVIYYPSVVVQENLDLLFKQIHLYDGAKMLDFYPPAIKSEGPQFIWKLVDCDADFELGFENNLAIEHPSCRQKKQFKVFNETIKPKLQYDILKYSNSLAERQSSLVNDLQQTQLDIDDLKRLDTHLTVINVATNGGIAAVGDLVISEVSDTVGGDVIGELGNTVGQILSIPGCIGGDFKGCTFLLMDLAISIERIKKNLSGSAQFISFEIQEMIFPQSRNHRNATYTALLFLTEYYKYGGNLVDMVNAHTEWGITNAQVKLDLKGKANLIYEILPKVDNTYTFNISNIDETIQIINNMTALIDPYYKFRFNLLIN